eukprot:182279-Rhodomonas_salina.2
MAHIEFESEPQVAATQSPQTSAVDYTWLEEIDDMNAEMEHSHGADGAFLEFVENAARNISSASSGISHPSLVGSKGRPEMLLPCARLNYNRQLSLQGFDQ